MTTKRTVQKYFEDVTVTWTWRRVNGREVPVRVTVDAPTGITMRGLRSIKMATPFSDDVPEGVLASLSSLTSPPGRRIVLDDRMLSIVAAGYVGTLAAGHGAAERLASQLRDLGHEVDGPRVRQLVYAARERGLLARTTPGRAQGGRLTPKARRILAATG